MMKDRYISKSSKFNFIESNIHSFYLLSFFFFFFLFKLQHGLLTQLLRLAHNCLTFDFIGTSTDESSDDLCTVHCPTSWRPAFLDFSTLKLFFDLYHSLPTTLSPLVSMDTTGLVFSSAFQIILVFSSFYRPCHVLCKLHQSVDPYSATLKEGNFWHIS